MRTCVWSPAPTKKFHCGGAHLWAQHWWGGGPWHSWPAYLAMPLSSRPRERPYPIHENIQHWLWPPYSTWTHKTCMLKIKQYDEWKLWKLIFVCSSLQLSLLGFLPNLSTVQHSCRIVQVLSDARIWRQCSRYDSSADILFPDNHVCLLFWCCPFSWWGT